MRLSGIFQTTDKRNKMLRKNIFLSAIIKIVGILTSLIIVPITLHYLESEQYGIWMTISSILYWFAFFDVGLGNGMRNYLTQALSLNDYQKGRKYLSTTLFLLSCIAGIIALLSTGAFALLDFNWLFNTNTLSNDELRNIMIIAVTFTIITFVLKNIGLIFVALQKYAINDLLTVSGNVIALIIIYILTKCTNGRLLYVITTLTMMPAVIYLIAAIPIFKKYPQLRPSLKCIDLSLAKEVVGKGLGFFLIQITSCLVIFGSSNLIITQYCGAVSVTIYNIAYKYFHLISIAYIIILSPMWNAYTDAFVKHDMHWINKNFNKTLTIWGISVAGGFIMLTVCNLIYRIWVGSDISIPLSISFCVLIYISFFNFNTCVTYLLNGLNKIRVQIMTSIIFTAVYLTIIFCYGSVLRTEGVLLCMSGCYLCMGVIHYYQCRMLIKQKAQGIWNK